jgi:hypothetical protein
MRWERVVPEPENSIQMKERTISIPPSEMACFIWSLGGYDNLCTAEIVRKQRGKISLRYPGNIESEVLQVVESLFQEMAPTGTIDQGVRL